MTAEGASGAPFAVPRPASGSCTRTASRFLMFDGSVPENTFLAGSTDAYNVEIQNRDSTGCGPSTFALASADLPAGFTLDAPPMLVPPGGFVTAVAYVTSPASQATGQTTFQPIVAFGATRWGRVLTTADIAIGSQCVHTTPLVKIAPQSQTTTTGGELDYTVTVEDIDGSNCGSTSTIDLSAAPPSGFT